jgi:hypothetical protein
MKTYIIKFRGEKDTEQNADWFTLSADLGTPIARFFKKDGASEDRGELIAAFTDVVSVVQKDTPA